MVSFSLLCYFVAIGWLNLVAGHSIRGTDSPQEGVVVSDNGNDYLLLNLGNIAGIDKRQTPLPTLHNISQVVTPLVTGRWIASIESQLQVSPQTDEFRPSCTISICTGPLICGARQTIGETWSKLSLKVQLRANQPQLISFVTDCSAPAYVGLKNMVIPGLGQALASTVVSTLTTTFTLPPVPLTITETQTLTPGLSTIAETQTVTLTPELSTITVTAAPGIPTPDQPVHRLFLTVRNLCASSDVLISSLSKPEVTFLRADDVKSTEFTSVYSNDPRVFFTSLTGRRMCAEVTRTGETNCGTDYILASGLIDLDEIGLTCPDALPSGPSADFLIPMTISTTDTSPHFVLQIDCSNLGTCATYISGSSVNTQFGYPVSEQTQNFRVRILAFAEDGERLSYVEWRVGFSNGHKETTYLPKGLWLGLSVPLGATSIGIYGNGHENGSIPEEEAGTVD